LTCVALNCPVGINNGMDLRTKGAEVYQAWNGDHGDE
jgi:hypothetical protein